MKIVNRKEFLELPTYTLFAKCGNAWIGELNIKGVPMEVDFCSTDFKSFEFNDSGELAEKFDQMINGKEQFPVAPWEDTTQDGMFDKDQLFMIYDKQDIKKIIETLQECLDQNFHGGNQESESKKL